MGQTLFAIETVCIAFLSVYLFQTLIKARRQASHREPPTMADYLYKIARVTGHSEYDVFCKSAEDWPVSREAIERDFERYLKSQNVPHYVTDFVRRNKKHIDALRMPQY